MIWWLASALLLLYPVMARVMVPASTVTDDQVIQQRIATRRVTLYYLAVVGWPALSLVTLTLAISQIWPSLQLPESIDTASLARVATIVFAALLAFPVLAKIATRLRRIDLSQRTAAFSALMLSVLGGLMAVVILLLRDAPLEAAFPSAFVFTLFMSGMAWWPVTRCPRSLSGLPNWSPFL